MKVFLSSTYNDLIEHRQAAHDALAQLGLHVIWMESFGARPIESTKACLDEIEECDLFVGIYAHRYGYIPEYSSISITEQEFRHAQEFKKPIFGFVVNEAYTWPTKHVEHDKKDELEAFLISVKRQPVEFFSSPDNLASNIASSVGRYLIKRVAIHDAQSKSNIAREKLLQVNPTKLRKVIHSAYDRYAFERLLKDNGLDYHDLPEGPLENKVMYFIDLSRRRQIYDKLISQVLDEHPELRDELL